jgi:hypothetical protein
MTADRKVTKEELKFLEKAERKVGLSKQDHEQLFGHLRSQVARS